MSALVVAMRMLPRTRRTASQWVVQLAMEALGSAGSNIRYRMPKCPRDERRMLMSYWIERTKNKTAPAVRCLPA